MDIYEDGTIDLYLDEYATLVWYGDPAGLVMALYPVNMFADSSGPAICMDIENILILTGNLDAIL